eukprot:3779029-Rhodomonas_salina.4
MVLSTVQAAAAILRDTSTLIGKLYCAVHHTKLFAPPPHSQLIHASSTGVDGRFWTGNNLKRLNYR